MTAPGSGKVISSPKQRNIPREVPWASGGAESSQAAEGVLGRASVGRGRGATRQSAERLSSPSSRPQQALSALGSAGGAVSGRRGALQPTMA